MEAMAAFEAMAAMAVDDDDECDGGGAGMIAPPASESESEPPVAPRRRAVLAPPPLPLDWTRLGECAAESTSDDGAKVVVARYPWDVIDIDACDERLTIVGTAGQKITRMGEDLHAKMNPKLTHLILRSHLLRTMEGIGPMRHLELLELYDNQVDELRCLDLESGPMGANLRVLDISYNVIRDMGPLVSCPNLEELCEFLPFRRCRPSSVVRSFVLACVRACVHLPFRVFHSQTRGHGDGGGGRSVGRSGGGGGREHPMAQCGRGDDRIIIVFRGGGHWSPYSSRQIPVPSFFFSPSRPP